MQDLIKTLTETTGETQFVAMGRDAFQAIMDVLTENQKLTIVKRLGKAPMTVPLAVD